MKLIKIALIVLVGASVYSFVTSGERFHIAKTLPFCNGRQVHGAYEIGGLILLGLFIWGLCRLSRNNKDDSE